MFFDDSNEVINRYTTNINYDAPDSVTFFSGGDGKIKLDSAESLEKIVDFNKLKVERIIPLYAIYSTSNFENDEYISDPGKKSKQDRYMHFCLIKGKKMRILEYPGNMRILSL